MKLPPLLLVLLAAGCADFPRDQSGTLERVRSEGRFNVGVVSTGEPPAHADRLRALVERVGREAGARPAVRADSAEPLLIDLEQGKVDLIVGEFDARTPWRRRVHMIPPLATETRGGSRIEVTGAARSGENGWIMLLERAGRAPETRP